MLEEMRDPAGGFWSSLDADSEGEEGKFYVWSFDEWKEVAGDDAEVAAARWGVTPQGNFEGKNIPVDADPSQDIEVVERARAELLARRAGEDSPGHRHKGADGLELHGRIRVGGGRRIFETSRLDSRLHERQSSSRCRKCVRRVGCCARTGATSAERPFAIWALPRTTPCCSRHSLRSMRPRVTRGGWRRRAGLPTKASACSSIGTTADSSRRVATPEALVVRPKDLIDNAVPSANSVLALELQKLALITGDDSYEKHAVDALRIIRDAMPQSPQGFGHALQAVDFYSGTPAEIVIVGPDSPERTALVDAALEDLNLNRVVIVSDEPTAEDEKMIPLLQDRNTIDGRPTAFVCRNGTCKLPVTGVEELRRQLAEL